LSIPVFAAELNFYFFISNLYKLFKIIINFIFWLGKKKQRILVLFFFGKIIIIIIVASYNIQTTNIFMLFVVPLSLV
jgi:hypothetical protein